jgi:sialidase-1
MNRRDFLKTTGFSMCARAAAARPAAPERVTVYRAGADGYNTYRIPAILRTRAGTLLAFAEARKNSRSDFGDIDTVVKRSSDGGRTWSAQTLIADRGPDSFGNPCPVIDARTGTILLPLIGAPGWVEKADLMSGRAPHTVWLTTSKDDGRSWSRPREITAQVKAPDWTWFATGPGIGIQLRDGRLVIPANHRRADSDVPYSFVMASTDGGESWKAGAEVGEKTNECQVAELPNGDLVINMRSFHGRNRRAVARSRDQGRTWTGSKLHEELIEPACQASLIAVGTGRDARLLFSNPAATTRVNLTVRMSRDGGETWPEARSLHAGPSAYSCLVDLGGGAAGCLYERGETSPYEEICFTRFTLDWIAGGA